MKRRSIGLLSFPLLGFLKGTPRRHSKDEESIWEQTNSHEEMKYSLFLMGHSLRDGGGEGVVGQATHNRIKFLMGKVDSVGVRDARSARREGWRFSLPGAPSPAPTTTRSRPRDVDKSPKHGQVEPSICHVV